MIPVRRVRGALPISLAVLLAVAAGGAAAAAPRVPNPSFEKGGRTPDGWTLEGGDGAWLKSGAPAGRRAVSVTGDGSGESYWRSDPVPFSPSTVYRLKFRARSVNGAGGTPITGPDFCNRDLGGIPGDWTLYDSVFMAPDAGGERPGRLRFGQWHVNGSVAFDDIELQEAVPVHEKSGDLLLGEGERVSGREYRFAAPFNGISRNHSRPLLSHRCGFNTNRWVFSAESEVVYRHRIGGRRQKAAEIGIGVTYHTGGELVVSVSKDGRKWKTVGTIGNTSSEVFPIPSKMLPAEEVFVRLRARASRPLTTGSDPGSFQVGRYHYRAEIDGPPADVTGSSRFLSLAGVDSRLTVSVDGLGDLRPGGDNFVRAVVATNDDSTVTIRPGSTVAGPAGGPPVTRAGEAVSVGRQGSPVAIPYEVPGTGEFALTLSFGDGSGWRAEIPFFVPVFYDASYGAELPGSGPGMALWWASSGWKVWRHRPVPKRRSPAIVIRAARNEAEAAQLVLRPAAEAVNLVLAAGDLKADDGSVIGAGNLEILRVGYVPVAVPTDASSVAGHWPDPLPPIRGPLDLSGGENHPFWIRFSAPRDAAPGVYHGRITISGGTLVVEVPLRVEVYDFELPDRMTCVTAFGFDPGNVWKYQRISDPADRRAVLEKYLGNFGSHHISPYDPAPLDPFRITWPGSDNWEGGRRVGQPGSTALLVADHSVSAQPSALLRTPVPIPKEGLKLSFRYRTGEPRHRFIVAFNHLDAAGEWMSGRNTNFEVEGNGSWQTFRKKVTSFPGGAKSIQLRLYASVWKEDGSPTGTVWFDDVSLANAATGDEYAVDGGFDPTAILDPEIDWTAWDAAIDRNYRRFGFNSFAVGIPGMGGGTFHARNDPELLGYAEGTPEYRKAFHACARAIERHLDEKGLLGDSFVYWFDEPDPKDYEFVMNGFRKLKESAPGIGRMLTEQPEPDLHGGPNIWCPVSHQYDHARAEERRGAGDRFWWYVCTVPQAPYAGLFIDHPGTDLRVWLWQTWKRGIEGILVWQTNYWTSPAAYPDSDRPQNPYADAMGWQTGYGLDPGTRAPWGNGDGRFIYPPESAADSSQRETVLEGPVDSIRWEMLRDGIEDYEYLAILRRLLERHRRGLPEEWRETFSDLLEVPETITASLTEFTKDPAPIEARRHAVARAIEELSRLRQ